MINGMLRWNARPVPVLSEHHPEEWSTVQLPVAWDPDAVCPDFDRFIDESVPEDDRGRLWQVIGYLMMSGNPLQRAFLLHGTGGNGKGVFLSVLRALLGRCNVSSLPLIDLAGDRWAPAELHGRLANICGDIDASYIEHTARIKEITGEDEIKAERKYGDPFFFEPWCKMIFSANGIPGASDSSTGWSRRWEVIGFPNAATDRPDPGLRRKLTRSDNLQGVAVKAVGALRDLMKAGNFGHGESARAAHLKFAQKSNKVLAWMNESGYLDPTSWYPKSQLWRLFNTWDREEGGRTYGRNGFYERLAQVPGMVERRRVGRDGFLGFRLTDQVAFGMIIEASEETAPEQPRGSFDPAQGTLL
jgi:putative DNA primase/helicase